MSLETYITNTIFIVIIVLCLVLYYYSFKKTLIEYPMRFIYLNLKQNNNYVKEQKDLFIYKIKKFTLAFAVVMIMSVMLDSIYCAIISLLFLVTYIIICHYLLEKSIKNIKKNNLNKDDNTALIKYGGLYYYNKADKRPYLDNTVFSSLLNYAQPFAKRMLIIVIIILLILFSTVTFLL
ncbi:hypothetical protein LJB88_00950 [Erysipelotrichaceae bacterium OttesenSCG-928-M19]|nr:hypothetical protein [Erysipelotrichaceae bacterium OttesenSCG-928-M19]